SSLHTKLSRLFLVELHALRLVSGGERESERESRIWSEFIAEASRDGYLDRLAPRYPGLRPRLDSVARLSVAAVTALARRLADDREQLERLLGAPAGEL